MREPRAGPAIHALWRALFGPPPRLTFDRIVSLGGLCEAAFQARRLSRSGRAYPLDWWITPLESVPGVLQDGAARCFAPEEIVKVEDYGGKPALYSRRSCTVHLHEFAKGEDFLSFDIETIAERLQAKYAALDSRLREDCAKGATLFVRQRLDAHDPRGDALEAVIDELCAALAGGAPDWRLLFLDYEPVRTRERLIQAHAPRLRDANDLGSRKGWNALFRDLGIACKSPERRFSYEDLRASFGRRR